MARTRTLGELRSDVCDRADVPDGLTTGRHTSDRLNRYINQAIQKYITTVTGAGGQDWYMKRTGLLTMATSQTRDANGWAPNMYVPLPSDFFELIGINLTIGSQTLPLLQFETIERNRFRDLPSWLNGNGLGQPMFYRIGGTDQAGNRVCELIPWADGSGYTYEILYIPEIADLVDDSDTFDGRAGFEEFVTNQAALNVLLNDGNTETPLYLSIKADRDEMQAAMKYKFATMGGPGRRMDTGALRQRLSRWARGDWRSD